MHFDALRGVASGDDVLLDNTAVPAFQTYHRHQVPPLAGDFPEWDQFRAAGAPVYPQRPELLGPRSAQWRGRRRPERALRREDDRGAVPARRGRVPTASGVVPPTVQSVLGDRTDDRYRVWFVDHAMHGGPVVRPDETTRPARNTRIVSYRGVLEQALRDVAAWASAAPRRRRAPTTNSSTARSWSRLAQRNAVASNRW